MKFEHQNIHFISDLHLGHKNIIKYDNRPFKDLDEMAETIIKNWNNKVNDNDVVYYLGDLTLGKINRNILNSLKGKIYIVMGNHDSFKYIKSLNRFEHIHEYGTSILISDKDANRGFQQIILAHYPFYLWDRHHHGSWHLHGHCHGSLTTSQEWLYERKIMDVGCNIINYTPISYQEVKKEMNTKKIVFVDHHTNETNI